MVKIACILIFSLFSQFDKRQLSVLTLVRSDLGQVRVRGSAEHDGAVGGGVPGPVGPRWTPRQLL